MKHGKKKKEKKGATITTKALGIIAAFSVDQFLQHCSLNC
jgi:hypothetical protein